jgi:peptidoglycan/LPS O-acetylase OafA/YrhL
MTSYPTASIAAALAVTYVAATIAGSVLARGGFPLPSGGRRIGRLDGLRGYLALSVLAHHFIIWLQITRLGSDWSPPTVNFYNNLGAGGVALFFMTTGCVFYPRVLAGFRATSWTATYTTRVFRIIPLILFSVAVITGVIALRTGHGLDNTFPKAAAIWITSWDEPPLLGYADSGRLNAYVLWSLRYEWLFYLFVLPACAFGMDLIRDRAPSWTLPTGLLFVSLALKQYLALGGLSTFLPFFAVGMLAYEFRMREAIRKILDARLVAAPAGVCLAIAMVSAPTPFGPVQIALYGFFFICVACGNDLAGLLRTKGSLVLGECSYGIYLLHGIVLSLLYVDGALAIQGLSTIGLPALLPFIGIAIACITPITYLAIERPAIRTGSAIAKLWFDKRSRTTEPHLEIASIGLQNASFQRAIHAKGAASTLSRRRSEL